MYLVAIHDLLHSKHFSKETGTKSRPDQIKARAESADVSFEGMRETYLGNISLRRMGKSQDTASMALYLCWPAGGNISGQAISICGNVETR